MIRRECPKECQREACFCTPKPEESTSSPTPCEEKENNGIAGFYDDDEEYYREYI